MKKMLAIISALLLLTLMVSCTPSARSDTPNKADGSNNTSSTGSAYTPALIDYYAESGYLELPVSGASGYASVSLYVYAWDNTYLATLYPGQGFTILSESGGWWEIEFDGTVGWVEHASCMINLPDVIPSIVYNNTNTYASKMRSSGIAIPNVTGLKLYDAYGYNARFDKDQYIMPVLYSTAIRICWAQHAALEEGDTLIIYEAFRPYEPQQRIYTNLTALINSNPVVSSGVSIPPWSISWFILAGTSNHQVGYAMDVSLGKAYEQEKRVLGNYVYQETTFWKEYVMPTPIHDLSYASTVFTQPLNPYTDDWLYASYAGTMNAPAILLQDYCTYAGMTPLASEWWHFNDNVSRVVVEPFGGNGNYYISQTYSVPPLD